MNKYPDNNALYSVVHTGTSQLTQTRFIALFFCLCYVWRCQRSQCMTFVSLKICWIFRILELHQPWSLRCLAFLMRHPVDEVSCWWGIPLMRHFPRCTWKDCVSPMKRVMLACFHGSRRSSCRKSTLSIDNLVYFSFFLFQHTNGSHRFSKYIFCFVCDAMISYLK